MKKSTVLFSAIIITVLYLVTSVVSAQAEINPDDAIAINTQLSIIEKAVNDGMSAPITDMLGSGTSLSATVKKGIEGESQDILLSIILR